MAISFVEFKKMIREDNTIPDKFNDEYGDVYKLDNRARCSINKTLGTKFRAVFRDNICYQRQWKAKDIDMETGHVYIITEDYRVLVFNNSEWFSIQEEL